MNARKTRAAPRATKTKARVAIVRARWNEDVTLALERGAIERATATGAATDLFEVAGSFELPGAVALLCDSGRYDAVVPIGCLIRGETLHFELLAHAVARALADLSTSYPVAIPFGVLACDTIAQAMARSGGDEGNAGAEAMAAALELVALRQALSSERRSARPRSRASSRSTR
ncbi:MAG TPA: 6,7-dimethyl-8-ribityllumazine synthase [Candidatus Limnocylindria bacterium]